MAQPKEPKKPKKSKEPKKPKYIYLLQEQEEGKQKPTGYYKVGRTINRPVRKQQLGTGNPRKLTMICCTERKVDQDKENTLKAHMKTKARHCGREWFYTKKGKKQYMQQCFKEGTGGEKCFEGCEDIQKCKEK